MRGLMFFSKSFSQKIHLFISSLYLSIFVYYASNYKPIYRPQVLNNQEIKLLNPNLIRNLTF
jgi:hypothetical protein